MLIVDLIQEVEYLFHTKNNKKQLAPMVDQLVETNVDVLVAGGGLEAEAIKSNTQKQSGNYLKNMR